MTYRVIDHLSKQDRVLDQLASLFDIGLYAQQVVFDVRSNFNISIVV